MLTFPYERCPAAADLVAFITNKVLPDDLTSAIENHISTCDACRRSITQLGEFSRPPSQESSSEAESERRSWQIDDLLSDYLKSLVIEQRGRVRRMIDNPRPEPSIGQVWTLSPLPVRSTSHEVRSSDVFEVEQFLLVVVLRTAISYVTNAPVVNLAPITEDRRLAAEWSLVFDELQSGIGTPVVIHVDHERTAPIESLGRCVGRLPERAGNDLLAVIRTWSDSGAVMPQLEVGCLGEVAIRTHPSWRALDSWLARIMDNACMRPDDESVDPSSDAALLAPTGTSGPTEQTPRLDAAPKERLIPSVGEYWAATSLVRRIAEQGVTPAQGDFVATIGAAIHAYLADQYAGSLQTWTTARRTQLEARVVEQVSSLSLSHLRDPPTTRQKVLLAHLGADRGSAPALFELLNDVKYYLDKCAGLLAGAPIQQRAARRQSHRRNAEDKGDKDR